MTLRTRVTLAAGLAVAIAIAIASATAWMVVRSQLRAQVDESLRGQASVLQSSGRPPPGGVAFTARRPDDTARFFTDTYVQVLDSQGTIVSSFGDRELPVDGEARKVATGTSGPALGDVTVDGVHVRVLTTEAPGGGAVQIGRSLAGVESTLSRLALGLGIVALGGTVLATVLGRATAATATAPVQRLSRAAETVARTGDPSHPIAEGGDDELGRLARSFNAMLAALGASLQRQRELVADASHELRTPVASLRTNAEILQRSGDDLDRSERAEILTAVVSTTEEMSELIADLLEVARHEETTRPASLVRLDTEVEDAVVQARVAHPDITFVADLEATELLGSAADIRRAVFNLLDNAAKWSPPDGTVTVGVRDRAVTILDQGPGIAEEDLQRVFDRFYRSDQARGRPGSGLGLAIVRAVAQQHQGSVEAHNAPEGGAIITLRLG